MTGLVAVAALAAIMLALGLHVRRLEQDAERERESIPGARQRRDRTRWLVVGVLIVAALVAITLMAAAVRAP